MPAILALFISNLPTLIKAGSEVVSYVQSVREAAQQSGDWTDDHEAQFQAAMSDAANQPEWKPDAPPTA